ncbi:MAG TPA: hypothetical protein VGO55_16185 [Allosphingosinicella sp.]|jgi:hypothetical protein|nr:hypothetical protein [Allosphingosinicella sp.]
MTSAPGGFAGAFAIAAATPALLIGLYFGALAGPAALVGGFFMTFFLAALHVLFLAVPIHALLGLRRTPGPILVLASSFLIGGLPLPLLLAFEGLDGFVLFGLLGLSGGIAFLVMTGPREGLEDG